MPDPEQQHASSGGENQRVVDVLREAFASITNRLTPEVEAATIYRPHRLISDANNPLENTK